MRHLLISREYPPAPYPTGGIGTYADHISRLLAERGETVHVVAQRWPGAPRRREMRMDGRLVIHRVGLDEPLPGAPAHDAGILRDLLRSAVPAQAFSWQAARLAERICDDERVDVIEAQEYEAPLYYLLRWRRQGSGLRRAPVVVHLHTPSEWLLQYNDVDTSTTGHQLSFMLEEYTIRGADALLCPSRFLADKVANRYALSRGDIAVLPYPVGDMPARSRPAQVWQTGTICFIGRLEPRKGVQEVVSAVAAVPAACLSLIGTDAVHWGTGAPSMRESLIRSIPSTARERIQFLGTVPHTQLGAHLQRARIGVVPSRFENFPNSCIELMASGLPVVVSPNGGMAEMVEDGVTGWVARGSDAASLQTALVRALSQSPHDLANMGAAAASAIRRLCDNETTVRSHVQFRQQVVTQTGAAVKDTRIADQLDDLAARIDSAMAGAARSASNGVRTMSVADIIRAPRRQQFALIRRALGDPGYLAAWLRWRASRMASRLLRR